jgi:hypothetical protein
MYHGLLVAPHAGPACMPTPAQDPEAFRHELLMSVGCGSGLGELYVTPSLMTPEAWDQLAAALKWNRAHRDILRDAHWVGGKPASEVYGYAAWHPRQGGTVVLRNATGKPQTFVFNTEQVFDLPAGAVRGCTLRNALGTRGAPFSAGPAEEKKLVLRPYEVRLYEATFELTDSHKSPLN